MKKAIITPILVNLLIFGSISYFFGGQADLGGALIWGLLIFVNAPWVAGLFVGTHALIALFYFFYSDRNLTTKSRLINFVIYLLAGVVIFVPYLLKFLTGLAW